MRVFTNCYTYNIPEYEIYKMAKGLEEMFLSKLTAMPEPVRPSLSHYRTFIASSTPAISSTLSRTM